MTKKMVIIPVSLVLFILSFTIFGDRGLLRIYRLNNEKEQLQKRMDELAIENDRLKKEIQALKTDKKYIERIARKEFGLVKKEEIIYQFPSRATNAVKKPDQQEKK